MYGVPWPISVVQLAVGDSVDGWSKDAFSIVVHHDSKRAPIWVDSTETNKKECEFMYNTLEQNDSPLPYSATSTTYMGYYGYQRKRVVVRYLWNYMNEWLMLPHPTNWDDLFGVP